MEPAPRQEPAPTGASPPRSEPRAATPRRRPAGAAAALNIAARSGGGAAEFAPVYVSCMPVNAHGGWLGHTHTTYASGGEGALRARRLHRRHSSIHGAVYCAEHAMMEAEKLES